MPDTHCPGCRHTVPAGRWCNRCGAPLTDATERVDVEVSTSTWRPRLLAIVGVAATIGVLLWGGGRSWQSGQVTSQEVDGAVVLAEDALPSSSPSPPASPRPTPAAPTVPPEDRTNVVCSDLRPRSVPTADLVTNEPGELVELGDRTCVVMRAEGVTVP